MNFKNHQHMVSDPNRTPLIQKAIEKCVKPGMRVFDLGCGTGILTLTALKKGATVYACEVDPKALSFAKKNIAKAGFSDRIVFFDQLSSHIQLPEKVDVILCELIGSLAFNENILPFINDARTRFLKTGGIIIPQSISLYVAPLHLEIEKISQKKKSFHQFPFMITKIKPKSLLSKEINLIDVDFLKSDFAGIDCEQKFTISKKNILTGFGGWIKVTWRDGFVTNTAPTSPLTHWKQAYLPLAQSQNINPGDQILFRLRIGPRQDDSEFTLEPIIEWGYK